MKAASAASVDAPGDGLTDLQLQVARRADRLARHLPRTPLADRAAWLRAEQEVFERLERSAPLRAAHECGGCVTAP